jgi:lysophospholipase L1-like esterase
LAAAALLLSGLGAEAYLRRFHPIGATIYRLHPRYLHALVPGARKLFVHRPANGGAKLLVRVNGDGFLGPELARSRGGPRVVVYGDSFVAAEFSSSAESFVGRLGARLGAALGQPVEAINAGVAGYGPDQVLLRLEDELATLAPDLVVVAVFAGNDFGDLMRDKLFRLGSGGALESRSPRIAPALAREFARAERLGHGSMLLRGLGALAGRRGGRESPDSGRSSLLPEGGFPLLLEKRRREYQQSIVGRDDEVLHLLGDPYDADLSLSPGSESARYKVALMEQVLVRMADAARARGTPVLFVFIPSAFDVCDGWEHPDAAAFPEYGREALTAALSAIAQRRSLQSLDLFPHFREGGADALYFRGDEHWNAAGQDRAAALAVGRIVAEKWLSSRPREEGGGA